MAKDYLKAALGIFDNTDDWLKEKARQAAQAAKTFVTKTAPAAIQKKSETVIPGGIKGGVDRVKQLATGKAKDSLFIFAPKNLNNQANFINKTAVQSKSAPVRAAGSAYEELLRGKARGAQNVATGVTEAVKDPNWWNKFKGVGKTALGAFQFAQPDIAVATGPARAAAAAAIGAGIRGIGAKFTGKDVATEVGKGATEGTRFAAVTKFTDPLISKAASVVAPGMTSFFAKQGVTRAITGIGNVIEDEIISKLDEYKPTNSDRAISLAVGAALGGNDELFDQAKRQVQKILGKNVEQASHKEIAKATKVTVERLRDELGQYAKEPVKPKVKEKIDWIAPDPNQPNNLVRTVNGVQEVPPPKTPSNVSFVRDPNNPRTLLRHPKQQALGLVAGLEMETDENGQPTGKVTYNSEKGVAGFLAAGFLTTGKHQDAMKALVNDSKTPQEALDKLTGYIGTSLKEVGAKIAAGDMSKETINEAKGLRAAINKVMYSLAGVDPAAGKQEKVFFEAARQDPDVGPMINELEFQVSQVDDALAGKQVTEAIIPTTPTAPKTADEIMAASIKKEDFAGATASEFNQPKTPMDSFFAKPTTEVQTPQPRTQPGRQPRPATEIIADSTGVKPQPELPKDQTARMSSEEIVPSDTIISQAREQIGRAAEPPKPTIKQELDDLYTKWVDRFTPIVRAAETAKKALKGQGAELRPEYDPTILVRRLTGAGGIADTRFRNELEPVLKELEAKNIDKVDMDAYLANKRMAGFGTAGRDIYGVDPEKAKQVVAAMEAKYGPEISAIADKLYQYQDAGFKEMQEAGFFDEAAANAMRQQNPDYAPLYRVMDEVNDYLGVPTRKTMQGSQPIKKIKGSTRKIESPVESIIGNTFSQRAAIEKNRVAKAIVGLQDVADLGFKKASQAAEDTITVWENGKKLYFQVGKDIADVAKGVNEEQMNMVLKILQAPASLLRQGATGRNPEFMIPNVVRDQLDAGITSKYGYIPFVDYIRGLSSMIKNDDIYKKWEASGAKIDLGEMAGKKSIQTYFDEKTGKKGLFNWLTTGLDIMGKYSEQPTRVGLFKRAYEKTGNEMLAMLESRDATVDFSRMGSKMKVANSIVPFLNVGVQGFDKLIRSVKDHPGKVIFNATLYGGMPAAVITAYNLMEHPEEYAEIPQYEKDSNFVIVIGRNENGNVDYVTFPKGNILPVITNPVQSFLEFAAGADSQTFGELATNLISGTLPVLAEGATPTEVAIKTIGSNLPQAIKPAAENLLNKSFYKFDPKKQQTKEIVPFYLQDAPDYQQTYEFTPQMYQKIGALLDASPLKVQNLMEGYLAGYSKIPAQLVEMAYKVGRGDEISPNDKTLLRRFVKQTYPSSGAPAQPKIESPSLMERMFPKAGAAEEGAAGTYKELTQQEKDRIKTKLKYDQKVTSDELVSYYLSGVKGSPEDTGYKKTMRVEKLLSKYDSLEDDDSITESQRKVVQDAILKETGMKSEDIEYWQTAKLDNDLKYEKSQDDISSFTDHKQVVQYLVDGRRVVAGEMFSTPGLIDAFYENDLITKDERKYLKALKWDDKTQEYKLDRDYKASGSGKSGATKAEMKAFFKAVQTPAELSKTKIPKSSIKWDQVDESSVSEDDTKITVKAPKAPSMQEFFQPKPGALKTSEARALVDKLKVRGRKDDRLKLRYAGGPR